MRFEPANLQKSKMYYKSSANVELLEKFRESGLKCAKVLDYTTKNGYYCASSLRATAKRYKMANITAVSVGGVPYLINTEVE